MRTWITAVACMAVPWVVGFQFVGADVAQEAPKRVPELQGAHTITVVVDEVVALAMGEGAVAKIRIANQPPHHVPARNVTVRVRQRSRTAVGPKAVACIDLPSMGDAQPCD